MAGYLNKYHVAIDGQGYIISKNRNAQPYYEKRLAPVFVNKFGSGDSSYRDSTFWQYWAQTNWRNGAKQLRLDDSGKFWKSENIDITELEEISLSKALTLIGQTASGNKINTIGAWRTSQNWWNANYGYRQQLTITNNATSQLPAGYPVKITIDTSALQTAGKVRSDRKDWRVLYFNGSSWVDLKRDYVATGVTVFSLQAAINAGATDTNYFVYYGYAGESTDQQPSTNDDWNSVYEMYGGTPDANTIASWLFKDGSGTTVTDTKNTHNLSTSGMGWATDGPFGRMGSFSGAGDYASLDDSGGNFNLGSITVEAWIRTGATLPGTSLLAARVNGSDQSQWYLKLTSDGHIHFIINAPSTGGYEAVGSTTLQPNTIYHVAGTYNGGSTIKVYVNNNLDGSGTNTEGAALSLPSATVWLGKKTTGGTDEYNGEIGQVRVSNIERTSFPYAIAADKYPTVTPGTEVTTQPPASSFDGYVGGTDGILYKWDGVSSFSVAFDCRRVKWYDDTTTVDTNTNIGHDGTNLKAQAQSFQIDTSGKVKGVEVYLKKNTGTPGNLTVRIETDSTGKPSGTLADSNLTATISAFSTATYGWISVEFPNSATLNSGTTYWLVIKPAAEVATNYYNWGADGSSPAYSNGNMAQSTDGGSTWTADTTKDAMFRIKGEATALNDLLVSSVGGNNKMLIASGDISSQTNGNARLYSYDGSNFALEHTFNTVTESQITKLAEYNGKLYAGVGPQARIYEGTSPTSWTLSKDINVPQNPGYIYAFKEYNGKLYAGGGSPEFLNTKYYNGFWFVFDATSWESLYPFDFTVVEWFEFYDAFLFGCTYRGDIYVYDTASLNPLFSFKTDYKFQQNVRGAQLFDDKIYFFLYPQEGTNDTNIGVWMFDRHGLSLAHNLSGEIGFRCGAVVNDLLLIGTGDSGNVYKLDPDVYASSGYLQSSYFDANLPSINKLYNSVTIQHDPLPVGSTINLYYKFKEADSWTLLGTSNNAGDTSKVLSFPSQTFSKKISLKTELLTTDTSQTPKVTEIVMQYVLLPTPKWIWTLRVLAKKNLKLLDGTLESRDVATIRSDIEASLSGQKLVNFVDIDGTSYTVLLNSVNQDSWVLNQKDTNEDEIIVSMLQA